MCRALLHNTRPVRASSLSFPSPPGVLDHCVSETSKAASCSPGHLWAFVCFLWISLMSLSLEAAKLIFLFGWRRGSLVCGSRRVGNTWIAVNSLLSPFWFGAPALRWCGHLTACCWFLMTALSSLILEATEGVVDFGWHSASIFCAPTLTAVKKKMQKNIKKTIIIRKKKYRMKKVKRNQLLRDMGHGTACCFAIPALPRLRAGLGLHLSNLPREF